MDANLPEILVGIDGPGDDLIDHLPKAMRRASLSAEEIEEWLRFNHPNRERHRRYVLIDEISGHVWGDVVAADPIKACRAIDTRYGQHKRKKYTDIGSAPFDGHPGYHVYLTTSATAIAGVDGQDKELGSNLFRNARRDREVGAGLTLRSRA
jgi:hypothetical protein